MGAATMIAVVADSHGLWRPEIGPAIEGAARILHAGDVGRHDVLERLSDIAPVDAIRGNVDIAGPVGGLPETFTGTFDGVRVHMIHAIADLDGDPVERGWDVVISGHSHRASVETRAGVLYLNPGAIGPKRFGLPVTLARLRIVDGAARAEIVTLDV